MNTLQTSCSVSFIKNTAPDWQNQRHHRIECRAYDRWLARGCRAGSALEDWLEA